MVNKESKHKLCYSGRVKALCLQKNTALWIGTGGGHILLLDLSTRRVIRTIHNFCDSVRALAMAQLGKFLSFRYVHILYDDKYAILKNKFMSLMRLSGAICSALEGHTMKADWDHL